MTETTDDEEALARGLAQRARPPLTLAQARERLERGGRPYRELLQRGQEAFVQAVTQEVKVRELRAGVEPSLADEPQAARDALEALARHEVPEWTVKTANGYWGHHYDRESEAAWRAETFGEGAQRLAEAHYVRLAVFEYAWPGNQDAFLRMIPPPPG